MNNGDRVRRDLYKQHCEHSGTHVRPVFPDTIHRLDMHGRWTSPHALQVFVAESDRCVGSEDPQGALSPSDVPHPSVKFDLEHRKRTAGVALSGTIADISPLSMTRDAHYGPMAVDMSHRGALWSDGNEYRS
jgi:hypothetical protein